MQSCKTSMSESCQQSFKNCLDSKQDHGGANPMKFLKDLVQRRKVSRERKSIQSALDLRHLGDGRRDGLTLTQVKQSLEIEWRARDIHPWDRGCAPAKQESLFTEQSFADTEAVLSRLFEELPAVDEIAFKVIHPESDQCLFDGKAERPIQVSRMPGVSARTRLWRNGVTITMLVVLALALIPCAALG
jgi:hypothetical protein